MSNVAIAVGSIALMLVFIYAGGDLCECRNAALPDDDLMPLSTMLAKLLPIVLLIGIVILYVALILLLGTIIDSSSILLIVLPLMLPIATEFGLSLIWFGVVTVVAVEIGLSTPPFGLSVHVIKSTLADSIDISLTEIFRGTAPFTLTMLAVLILLLLFPSLSLMLLK